MPLETTRTIEIGAPPELYTPKGTPSSVRTGGLVVPCDCGHDLCPPSRNWKMEPQSLEAALMIITTMNELPGYDIEEVVGEVFGLTVRSRNVGAQIGAGLKSLVGGELRGMTKMLAEGREHATQRLVEEAEGKGANAIVAFRYDTSELGDTWTEVCAYGTAVRARKR
jgi:uncharacterized protein YbjQ (UPF0145 family)